VTCERQDYDQDHEQEQELELVRLINLAEDVAHTAILTPHNPRSDCPAAGKSGSLIPRYSSGRSRSRRWIATAVVP